MQKVKAWLNLQQNNYNYAMDLMVVRDSAFVDESRTAHNECCGAILQK